MDHLTRTPLDLDDATGEQAPQLLEIGPREFPGQRLLAEDGARGEAGAEGAGEAAGGD